MRLSQLRGLAGAIVLAVLPAVFLAPASEAASAQPFGLYQNPNNLSYSIGSSSMYVSAIQYYGWNEGVQSAEISALPSTVTPFLELQTCGNPCNSGTSVPLSSILAGNYDAYLAAYARSIASLGRPVYLTFDHEMNGSWYPWDWYSGNTQFTSQAQQQSEWIQAWNYVTNKINANVTAKSLITWVWAPNIEQGGSAVSNYWSSGNYTVANVNRVGLDGYYANSSTTWSNRFAASYIDVESTSGYKPFMVSETGIPPGDSNATSQEANLISGAEGAGATVIEYYDSGSYVMTPAMQTAWLAGVQQS
jgi:hypothetical protein